jgi:hypothetical protein
MPGISGAFVTGLAILTAASGAASQEEVLRELRAQNAAAQSAEIAHQDLLALQREIQARQDQIRTALVLRELDAARTSPPGLTGSLTGPLIAPPTVAPEISLDSITLQMDRMERLTQDALARGNARIRAVRPASEH